MTMMEAEHRRTPGHAAEEPHRSGETAGATEKDPDAVGTIVVKIGGSTLGSHDTTLEDLVALQSQGVQPIVVHGGGKTISEWMERQGVRPRFVRGLRVTDEPSLDIVVGVLSGVVNKAIVASILALNGRAVGLSGVDGGMLRAKVMEPELGLVGSVVEVDPRPARAVIEAGFMPVIAPVAVRSPEAGAHGGSLLNVNADTAAGEIALALGAERLVFLTDVAGVMDSSRRVMPRPHPAAGGRTHELRGRPRAAWCPRSGLASGRSTRWALHT